jgi:hypothetical protein
MFDAHRRIVPGEDRLFKLILEKLLYAQFIRVKHVNNAGFEKSIN